MACAAIEIWNICISGFLQSEANPTGVRKLWGDMRAAVEGPTCRVGLRSWCQNWSDLAELVWSFAPDRVDLAAPIVNVFGYSWGGYSAVLFAGELQRRGLTVDRMVLCDAVYRHSYQLGQWRAFAPWSTIRVPANVRQVDVFRQVNPRFKWGRSGGIFQPAGHHVEAESPTRTILVKHWPLDCEHAYADDAPAFSDLSLQIARDTLAEYSSKPGGCQ